VIPTEMKAAPPPPPILLCLQPLLPSRLTYTPIDHLPSSNSPLFTQPFFNLYFLCLPILCGLLPSPSCYMADSACLLLGGIILLLNISEVYILQKFGILCNVDITHLMRSEVLTVVNRRLQCSRMRYYVADWYKYFGVTCCFVYYEDEDSFSKTLVPTSSHL
jgi:hypothetical protein